VDLVDSERPDPAIDKRKLPAALLTIASFANAARA
jgi:hypothetical protein